MATDLIISTNSDNLWRNIEYLEFRTNDGKESNMIHIDLKDLFVNTRKRTKVLDKKDAKLDFAKERKEKIEKVLTFGYRKTTEFLTAFFQAVEDQMPFLDPRTTVADCVRIMTCPHLELNKEKIYLACHTNEFKYILQYLRPYFKFLTNANIERSGIFISNLGNPITAGCLYNSKTQKLHTKPKIDAAYNSLSVK